MEIKDTRPSHLRHPELYKRIEELCTHIFDKTWTIKAVSTSILTETEKYFNKEK